MILTDYYKAVKLTCAESRYDVTSSTGEYDIFEVLLINKRKFNIGGLSFNCVERPNNWSGKKTDLAITKRSSNITSIKRPDITTKFGFGDIDSTNDACIIIFNPNNQEKEILEIEIFIGRGLRNDTISLWNLLVDGELDHEIKMLRDKAVTKSVTNRKV